jgi:hypothetical protein
MRAARKDKRYQVRSYLLHRLDMYHSIILPPPFIFAPDIPIPPPARLPTWHASSHTMAAIKPEDYKKSEPPTIQPGNKK